ncbi:MAG TPA: helix-turn-helix domain-containing protein [Mycobacterium sp.]|nr:helix-turn-helix domain-containing protein [Mycobacterium sp.]
MPEVVNISTSGNLDDVATTAEHLGISENSVRRLAAVGSIPSYRVGRQLRFNLQEVLSTLRNTPDAA